MKKTMQEKAIEMAVAAGFVEDGKTVPGPAVKVVTQKSWPLCGAIIVPKARLRFRKPETDQFLTIGRRTACFYRKPDRDPVDFRRVSLSELLAELELAALREAKRKQLNDYDLHNLRHMLGMNWTPPKDHGYRNRFCAARGEQLDSMRKMELLGYVVEQGEDGDYFSYHATRLGCEAAGLNPKGIERAMEGKE